MTARPGGRSAPAGPLQVGRLPAGAGAVPWWRSLRLPIAAAVALVSLATIVAVGAIVDQRSAVDGRERLRAQALERLNAGVVSFGFDGRLRFGATLETAGLPAPLVLAGRAGGQTSYFDGATMWASQPVGRRTLSVQVSGQDIDEQRAQLRRSLTLAGLVAFAVATLLGWLVATSLSRRLRRGSGAARRIATGAGDVRAAQPGRDEVAALTRSVDDMADALRRRLVREQEFSADVAHELRTPITALVSASELLVDDEVGRLVRDQVDRLRGLVADLLEISRLESGRDQARLEACDLSQIVRAVVAGLPEGGSIRLAVLDEATVLAEPRRVERILTNLITNAWRHGGGDCRVTVDGTRVVVDDDGPGYPDTLVTDGPRRFSSHGHGAGSGLGLTIALRQAEIQGASLTFENRIEGRAEHPVEHPLEHGPARPAGDASQGAAVPAPAGARAVLRLRAPGD